MVSARSGAGSLASAARRTAASAGGRTAFSRVACAISSPGCGALSSTEVAAGGAPAISCRSPFVS